MEAQLRRSGIQAARVERAEAIDALGDIAACDEWANEVLETVNEACKDDACFEDYGSAYSTHVSMHCEHPSVASTPLHVE